MSENILEINNLSKYFGVDLISIISVLTEIFGTPAVFMSDTLRFSQ